MCYKAKALSQPRSEVCPGVLWFREWLYVCPIALPEVSGTADTQVALSYLLVGWSFTQVLCHMRSVDLCFKCIAEIRSHNTKLRTSCCPWGMWRSARPRGDVCGLELIISLPRTPYIKSSTWTAIVILWPVRNTYLVFVIFPTQSSLMSQLWASWLDTQSHN